MKFQESSKWSQGRLSELRGVPKIYGVLQVGRRGFQKGCLQGITRVSKEVPDGLRGVSDALWRVYGVPVDLRKRFERVPRKLQKNDEVSGAFEMVSGSYQKVSGGFQGNSRSLWYATGFQGVSGTF